MKDWDNIVGNEQLKEYFLNAVSTGNLAHSYLITGEDGMGKMTIAKCFARTILCESNEIRPCGMCHSCKQMESGNHPDVIFVTHEKPNTIGVDDIRTGLVNDILIKPYSSKYKIYIVDEAEKMSVQAQNALLKTIEEPPAYGIVLLLTSNIESSLPTILSRCMILNMKPVNNEQITDYLRRKGIEQSRIDTALLFAQGNIGRAEKMAASEEFFSLVEQILYILKNLPDMDFEQLLTSVKQLENYKVNIEECLDYMQLWYRDVLLFKATNDGNLIVFKEELKYISNMAKRSTYNGIECIIRAIQRARRRLDANVNFELTMELLLLEIKQHS